MWPGAGARADTPRLDGTCQLPWPRAGVPLVRAASCQVWGQAPPGARAANCHVSGQRCGRRRRSAGTFWPCFPSPPPPTAHPRPQTPRCGPTMTLLAPCKEASAGRQALPCGLAGLGSCQMVALGCCCQIVGLWRWLARPPPHARPLRPRLSQNCLSPGSCQRRSALTFLWIMIAWLMMIHKDGHPSCFTSRAGQGSWSGPVRASSLSPVPGKRIEARFRRRWGGGGKL